MSGSDQDYKQVLGHDLLEAYGNIRTSVLAMGAELEPQARLGWLVFVERSARRVEDVLGQMEHVAEQALKVAAPESPAQPGACRSADHS